MGAICFTLICPIALFVVYFAVDSIIDEVDRITRNARRK